LSLILDLTKKKRKKINAIGPLQPKNAVCALNELRPGLEYSLVSQEGPTHSPVFTMSIEVLDITNLFFFYEYL
jgi:dsRNA-specific ribonuclease